MLLITTPPTELWDESKQEFTYVKSHTLQLEHSLVSLSKWESKWKKPFLSRYTKTTDETLDYIKCMTLTQNVSDDAYKGLSMVNLIAINEYIESPMTATTITTNSKGSGGSAEVITSELVYYWMIALTIPFECQKWHLNRLLTLIEICNLKSKPPTKRSTKDIMSRNSALNEARKKQFNTKG